MPHFGLLLRKEVEANESTGARHTEAGKEADGEGQELGSKEAHEAAGKDEQSASEWSDECLILGKWQVLDEACILALVFDLSSAVFCVPRF